MLYDSLKDSTEYINLCHPVINLQLFLKNKNTCPVEGGMRHNNRAPLPCNAEGRKGEEEKWRDEQNRSPSFSV